MRGIVRFCAIRIVALGIALVVPARAHALITNVDEATDICPANADPCNITQVVQLVPGATLDFGTREVTVSGAGRIDAPNVDFTLKCGKLRLLTGTNIALNLKGTTSTGTSAGIVNIRVQRRCSEDSNVTCVRDLDCANADAGVCTLGDGSATLGGRIFGTADDPAYVTVFAAGDITVTQSIQANGTSADSDGGSVDLE